MYRSLRNFSSKNLSILNFRVRNFSERARYCTKFFCGQKMLVNAWTARRNQYGTVSKRMLRSRLPSLQRSMGGYPRGRIGLYKRTWKLSRSVHCSCSEKRSRHWPYTTQNVETLFFVLKTGGEIFCTVTGGRRYLNDLHHGGLEIPCTLLFKHTKAKETRTEAADCKERSLIQHM